MSFGFTVAGDRDQVAKQLEAIRDDENQDSIRNDIARLLAEHVGLSELHGFEQHGTGWRQTYIIKASGHSGPETSLSLNVSIESPYIPVVAPEPVVTADDPAGIPGPEDED